MRRGFLYLVAIINGHSRQVLRLRLSNRMDAWFCVEASKKALDRYGPPEIFHSDRGRQITGIDFTQVLLGAEVKRSPWTVLVAGLASA